MDLTTNPELALEASRLLRVLSFSTASKKKLLPLTQLIFEKLAQNSKRNDVHEQLLGTLWRMSVGSSGIPAQKILIDLNFLNYLFKLLQQKTSDNIKLQVVGCYSTFAVNSTKYNDFLSLLLNLGLVEAELSLLNNTKHSRIPCLIVETLDKIYRSEEGFKTLDQNAVKTLIQVIPKINHKPTLEMLMSLILMIGDTKEELLRFLASLAELKFLVIPLPLTQLKLFPKNILRKKINQ